MRKFEEDYHKKQVEHPYRSTEVFIEWLEDLHFLNHDENICICDMACGGANTLYIGNRYQNIQVVGMDINQEFIDYGKEVLQCRSKHMNCKLYVEDWYHIDLKWIKKFDGIISFQTLFTFPEYRVPLKKLTDLQPKWIAFSSLFYEGNIEYTIKFKDYYRRSEGAEYTEYYYNIHSMPQVEQYLKSLGYHKFKFIPFDIDIDLPKQDTLDVGTYTKKTEDGKRIQISGGMMMPWYFVVAYN